MLEHRPSPLSWLAAALLLVTTSACDEERGIDYPDDCPQSVNVVARGIKLAIEIDLSGWEEEQYAIHETITVIPDTGGSSITLFGEYFDIAATSAPCSYDGHTATFCVEPFAAGDEVSLTLDYTTTDDSNGPDRLEWGLRSWDDGPGRLVLGPFNEPYFAPRWLFVPQSLFAVDPSHDDSPAAESVTMTVHAPDPEWTVVGPGGVGTNDGATWSFVLDAPTPLYAISFAASPSYVLVPVGTTESGVAVTGAVFPDEVTEAPAALANAVTTIDWMESHVGPYAFGDSLVIAVVPHFSGAMEHTGAIWLADEYLGVAGAEVITPHETVHHWWGDNVRFADWPHLWLAEGFTEWQTVFSDLSEHILPPTTNLEEERLTYRVWAAWLTFPPDARAAQPGPLRFADGDDMAVHYETDMLLYYLYGAAFLEMVNQRLIRDFDTDLEHVLTDWFTTKQLSAVTTEDLLAFLETLPGDASIWQPLFDDWVYSVPVPMLVLQDYGYTDGVASATITRSAGDQALLGLEVAFIAGGQAYTTTVDLPAGATEAVASVATPSAPTRIAIDPHAFYILYLEQAASWTGPEIAYTLTDP